jgi:hypothetical protein
MASIAPSNRKLWAAIKRVKTPSSPIIIWPRRPLITPAIKTTAARCHCCEYRYVSLPPHGEKPARAEDAKRRHGKRSDRRCRQRADSPGDEETQDHQAERIVERDDIRRGLEREAKLVSPSKPVHRRRHERIRYGRREAAELAGGIRCGVARELSLERIGYSTEQRGFRAGAIDPGANQDEVEQISGDGRWRASALS